MVWCRWRQPQWGEYTDVWEGDHLNPVNWLN